MASACGSSPGNGNSANTPPPDNVINVNIISFEPDPGIIRVGESTMLSWVVENATSCGIDHGIGAVDPEGDSVEVSPDADTIYSLDCTRTGDSDTAEAELTVYPSIGTLDNAIQEGGTGNDYIRDVLTRDEGTVYVAGYYNNADSLWGSSPSYTTLPVAGATTNGVIARYDANMNLAWAKRIKGAIASVLAERSDGRVILSGTTNGDAEFNPGEIDAFSVTNTGCNPFIAAVETTGEVIWAKSGTGGGCAGTGTYDSTSLSDDSGITVGSFSGGISFAQGTPSQTSLTATGTSSGYIAKYDSGGTFQWAKRVTAGSTGSVYISSVVSNPDGSFVVAGGISESATFGPGETNATTLTATPAPGFGFNAFLARYNDDGTLAWARLATSGANSVIYDLVRMSSGEIIAGGLFGFSTSYLSVTVGPGSPSPIVYTGVNNEQHAWIGRFSATGNLVWVKRSTGGLWELMWRLIINDGETAVTGFGDCAYDETIFGSGEAAPVTLSCSSDGHTYQANFSVDTGNTISGYVHNREGPAGVSDYARLDAYRDILAGSFQTSALTFGSAPEQTTFIPSGADAFIAIYWK